MNLFIREYDAVKLQNTLEGKEYYYITFSGTREGKIEHSIQTVWVGFTKTKPIREIREGRLYSGSDDLREYIEFEFDQSCIVINNLNNLVSFRLLGGNALIEKEIATEHLYELVKPKECMKESSHWGFVDMDCLPKSKQLHAPSKKLRMEILKRDNFRCRACGRSPNDYVDVELHVHHIIPFGKGGITEKENLITICKTCHDGLYPHYSPILSNLQNEKDKVVVDSMELDEKMYSYQEVILKYLSKDFKVI